MDPENTQPTPTNGPEQTPPPAPESTASSVPPSPPPPVPPPTYAQRVNIRPPQPSGNDKIWSICSHLSTLLGFGLGFFIFPLIVYLSMRDESEYVAENAREALNFHLSLLIYTLCCVPFVFIVIGFPLVVMIALGGIILSIIAAVKASDGECYRYPLTLRLVK
jgi:uncharacterized Tic20 family protein